MTSSKSNFTRFGRMGLSLVAAAACVLAASCGGGGGGGGANLSNNGGSTTAQQVATCDHNQPQSKLATPTTGNSVPVMIDSGPCAYGVPFGSPSGTAASVYIVNSANVPYTTVTICKPGSTTACQTIDHILVDTGSSGLRLMSSVLTGTATLPGVSVGGAPLIECIQFADGYSWGSMRRADVHIAGETAANIPVQVIGDSDGYKVPITCKATATTPALNDVGSFGANGVLGVGLFAQDCGPGCATQAGNNFYYTCATAATCTASVAAVTDQATNPVFGFTATGDNNGILLQFPAVAAASGALNIQGTLIFGINTKSNNQATASTLNTYQADLSQGDFISTLLTTTGPYFVTSTPYTNSFIDSGSNGIYLPGTTIATDPTYGWFTPTIAASGGNPADVITLTATQQGSGGGTAYTNNLTFEIANANTVLFNSGAGINTVFNGLGANSLGTGSTGGIDWGLPFFLGKSIFVALENTTINVVTTPQSGPFWAY